MTTEKYAELAIIVGKYQTHILHPEQIRMIREVIDRHSNTILVLGNSLMRGTITNPLDFRARKEMIQEKFPKLEVRYITDNPKNDAEWSEALDVLIKPANKAATIMIYGGKDTFVSKYTGKYDTCVFEASSFIGPDELRKQAMSNYPHNEDYRAGIVAAQGQRFPTSFQCVDVAIVDDNHRLLIARKSTETTWRFIGGFSDPKSHSLEEDARREVMEEANIEVDGMHYLGSTLISDSRYINEVDKIKTALFVAKYIFGRPKGGDDVAEVKWISIKNLKKEDIGEFHHILFDMFMEKFVNNETLYKKFIFC